MKFNLISAIESSLARSLIGGNQINLNAFYGGNELLSTHQVKIRSLEASVRLKYNSYVEIIYNYNKKESVAVRLSSSSIYPSSVYKRLSTGEFKEYCPIDLSLTAEKSHTVFLVESEKGPELYIDNRLITLLPQKFESGGFGFKSGLLGASVSDIKVIDHEGQLVETSLYNLEGWRKYLVVHFVFFLIFFAVLIFIFRKKNTFSRVLKTASYVLIIGCLWNLFDFFYYSKVSTTWDLESNKSVSFDLNEDSVDFEKMRFSIFSIWGNLLGDSTPRIDELEKRYGSPLYRINSNFCHQGICEYVDSFPPPKNIPVNHVRLGIIGTSFMAGTALEEDEETIFSQSYKTLFLELQGKYEVESFNLHFYSLKTKRDLNKYIELVRANKINYLIATNRVNFKRDPANLKALQDLFTILASMNVKVFYLDNFNNPEKSVQYILRPDIDVNLSNRNSDLKHYQLVDSIFKTAIDNKKLFMLRPNGEFQEKEMILSGDLWWDFYHMTAYGEKMFGQWLGKQISDYVKKGEYVSIK